VGAAKILLPSCPATGLEASDAILKKFIAARINAKPHLTGLVEEN
jgi:hypothetical protein